MLEGKLFLYKKKTVYRNRTTHRVHTQRTTQEDMMGINTIKPRRANGTFTVGLCWLLQLLTGGTGMGMILNGVSRAAETQRWCSDMWPRGSRLCLVWQDMETNIWTSTFITMLFRTIFVWRLSLPLLFYTLHLQVSTSSFCSWTQLQETAKQRPSIID